MWQKNVKTSQTTFWAIFRVKNTGYNRRDRISTDISNLSFFAKDDFVARESKFQAQLIKELKSMFPECLVLKNDSGYIQGIPDLLILIHDKWLALECKGSSTASARPNQHYYIEKMDKMSYAAFICPENREEILDEIQRSFKLKGSTRLS